MNEIEELYQLLQGKVNTGTLEEFSKRMQNPKSLAAVKKYAQEKIKPSTNTALNKFNEGFSVKQSNSQLASLDRAKAADRAEAEKQNKSASASGVNIPFKVKQEEPYRLPTEQEMPSTMYKEKILTGYEALKPSELAAVKSRKEVEITNYKAEIDKIDQDIQTRYSGQVVNPNDPAVLKREEIAAKFDDFVTEYEKINTEADQRLGEPIKTFNYTDPYAFLNRTKKETPQLTSDERKAQADAAQEQLKGGPVPFSGQDYYLGPVERDQMSNFINTQFADVPDDLRLSLEVYLGKLGERDPNAFERIVSRTGEPGQAFKSELLEKTLHGKINEVVQDADILAERIKADKQSQQQLQMLTEAKALIKQLEGNAVNQDENDALEQAYAVVDQLKGTTVGQYSQKLDDYDNLFGKYKTVIGLYPYELKRRKRIADKQDAVTYKPGDSALTKAKKQAIATWGSVQNAVVDATANFIKTAAKVGPNLVVPVDLITNTNETSEVSEMADKVGTWMDAYLKAPALNPESSQVFAKDLMGNTTVNASAIIPATAKTVTDMAMLIYGGAAFGGGKAGLTASGFVQSYNDLLEEALQQPNMDYRKAVAYASTVGLITAGLESVSPQGLAPGLFSSSKKAALSKLMDLSSKDFGKASAVITKEILKDVPPEVSQEAMQLVSEKILNYGFNTALGTNFDDQLRKEEAFEIVLLTTAATTVFGFINRKSRKQWEAVEAARLLKEKPEELEAFLSQEVESGRVDIEQARSVYKFVEDVKKQDDAAEAAKPIDKKVEALTQEKPVLEEYKGETEIEIDEYFAQDVPTGVIVNWDGKKYQVTKDDRGTTLTLMEEETPVEEQIEKEGISDEEYNRLVDIVNKQDRRAGDPPTPEEQQLMALAGQPTLKPTKTKLTAAEFNEMVQAPTGERIPTEIESAQVAEYQGKEHRVAETQGDLVVLENFAGTARMTVPASEVTPFAVEPLQTIKFEGKDHKVNTAQRDMFGAIDAHEQQQITAINNSSLTDSQKKLKTKALQDSLNRSRREVLGIKEEMQVGGTAFYGGKAVKINKLTKNTAKIELDGVETTVQRAALSLSDTTPLDEAVAQLKQRGHTFTLHAGKPMSKQDTDAYMKTDSKTAKIVGRVKQLLPVLAKSGIKIKVFSDVQSAEEAALELGADPRAVRGIRHDGKEVLTEEYLGNGISQVTYEDGTTANVPQTEVQYTTFNGFVKGDTIIINAQVAAASTVEHEFLHPIIEAILEKNPDLLVRFYAELQQLPEWEDLKDFVDQYKAKEQPIEALIEFTARVVSPEFKFKAKSATFKRKVVDFFKRLFGIDPTIKINTNNVLDFATSLKESFEKGIAFKLGDLSNEGRFGGEGRFQLAPNGKPSNLTPEQYAQVRTPEFIRFFGDWLNDPENASKVVDENGEPLVVFHGTNSRTDFYVFEPKEGSSSGAAIFGKGMYFSDSEEIARKWGFKAQTGVDKYKGEPARIISAFLDIKTPNYPKNTFPKNSQELGYDGVIASVNLGENKEFVVFSPTQIKSATENIGSFSPTNPDIRFSKSTTSSNKFSKALSLPEMDLSFDKFRDLAQLWKLYHPTKTEDDFYRYVKERVDRRVNKGFISAAFNDDPSYVARRMRAEMDTSEKKNTKESKAVKTMLRDPGTPQFLKDKLKELAGQYGQETHAEVERTANMILEEYGTQGALDQVENIPIPSVRVTVANKLIKRLNEMAANETNEEKKADIYYTNLQLMDSTAMYLRQLGQGVRANAMYSKMDKDGYVYAVNRMLKATRGNIKKRHKTAIDSMVAYAQLVARGQRAKILTEDQKTQILSGGKTREQIRGLKERAAEKLRAYGAEGFQVSPLEQDLLEYGYYEFLDGRQDKASWVRHMKNKGLARAEELFDSHNFGTAQNPQTLATMSVQITDLVSLIGTKDLASKIGQEMADMINKEHRKRVVATVKKKYERQLKKKGFHGQMAQALITAVEEGNYSTQALEDAMMHTMGDVQLSPSELAEIDQIYKDAGFLPEGRLRDEKLAEAWDIIYRHRKDQLKYSDVFWAFYYANILSGPGTQALNFFENALNLFLEPTVQIIQELGTKSEGLNKFAVVSQMTKGVLRGFFGVGVREMTSVIRTGKERFRGVNKYMDSNALEQVSKGTHDLTWAKLFRPSAWAMKYVPRVLGGMDAWFNQAHYELASVTSAARLVRQEVDADVTSRADAKKRFYEIITQKDTWVNAVQDANIELTESYRLMDKEPSGADFAYRVKTRAREIVLKQRQEQATKYLYVDMDEVSSAVAAIATYTSPPRGFLGAVANSFATLVKNVPIARFVIPFVNIVGNVYNRQLDYTPIGAIRAWKESSILTPKDSPFSNIEQHPGARGQRLIKSLIGTAAMAAAWFMFWDDDEEAYSNPNAFTIHGRGPSNYAQRKEMEATGWRQYSIQYKGKFYTFNWTPFSLALSIVANSIDFKRYHKNLDDKPMVDQVFANLTLLGSTLLSPSFVKSAADFLDFFTGEKEEGLMRFIGRTSTTVLTAPVPLSLFNAFHGTFDNQRYQADTFSESMIRNLPYFKAELRPALDAFGEPIKRSGLATEGFGYKFGELSGMNRFVSTLREDNDTFWYLREKNLWPPVITKNRVLFGKQYSDSTHYEIGKICGPNIKKLIDANRANIDAEYAYSADDADSYINGLMNNVIRQVESALLDQFPPEVVPTREEMAELADSGRVDWNKVKSFVDKAVYDIYLK